MPSAMVNAAITVRPSVPVNAPSADLNTRRTIAPSPSATTIATAISSRQPTRKSYQKRPKPHSLVAGYFVYPDFDTSTRQRV